MENKFYKNGEKAIELIGTKLTYYFKNGKVRAVGIFENEMMEGEWKFYRETGQLWSIGNFKNNMKHGSWVRFNRNDEIEYNEEFIENKIIKRKK